MAELRVKNVGPIKQGYDANNGFMPIKNLTIFIGNQGTGKSTIAKVYSTMSWIEKALVRGDFTPNYLTQYNRFTKQLAYQNISNYISNNSIIEYIGTSYKIKFQNNKLVINAMQHHDKYKFPKIMYVPAERNFVSSVNRPDLIKRLPLPLYAFLDEYEEAKKNLPESIDLPIGDLKFEYRKQNKKSWLTGPNFKIELLEASSGFQSFVPLFLVTKHITKVINKEENLTHKPVSRNQEERIRKEIDKILNNKNISEDIRRVFLEKLSSRFKYSCFVNIVEEPEQNLYPTSQREVLYDLIKTKNNNIDNQLIITTHSPYIINYLTLAIKSYNLKNKTNDNNILSQINDIVPLEASINSTNVAIYQLDENGTIKELNTYRGLPSDEHSLNGFLAEFNESFYKLIEIEDLCQ